MIKVLFHTADNWKKSADSYGLRCTFAVNTTFCARGEVKRVGRADFWTDFNGGPRSETGRKCFASRRLTSGLARKTRDGRRHRPGRDDGVVRGVGGPHQERSRLKIRPRFSAVTAVHYLVDVGTRDRSFVDRGGEARGCRLTLTKHPPIASTEGTAAHIQVHFCHLLRQAWTTVGVFWPPTHRGYTKICDEFFGKRIACINL